MSCAPQSVIRHLSGVDHPPYAPVWFPDTILDWTPASDVDAPFNRAHVVTAAKRERNTHVPMGQSNRVSAARVASLAAFFPTANSPSQDLPDHAYYAFGYWQYVDVLVYWGGSASEGMIVAPTAPVIDAAHRHGVEVYGTVFFPEPGSGGRTECVTAFLKTRKLTDTHGKEIIEYPVADKLVEVAEYFHFDGWFINQETRMPQGDGFQEFLTYATGKKKTAFMWYELSGELDNGSKTLLQNGGTRVSDSFFLDYEWKTGDSLKKSAAKAKEVHRDGHELYAGLEIAQGKRDPSVVAEHASFGLYATHTASMGANSENGRNLKKFHQAEATFWVGRNGDPSDVPGHTRWGLARYVEERTPVLGIPFVTNFNTGHGLAYYARGTLVGAHSWANLSVQDVQPSFRWIVRPTRADLEPRLDFDDAYEGGTSLVLTGKIEKDKPSTVPLYQTRLKVTSTTVLSVTLKTPAAGASHLQAAVVFDSAPSQYVTFDLGSTTGTGWTTFEKPLRDHAGKTIVVLGLATAAGTDVGSCSVRLGQIAVFDGTLAAPGAPSSVKLDKATHLTHRRRALRLAWQAVPGSATAPVHHYEIYRKDDGVERYLGATCATVYYVAELNRLDTAHGTTTIGVKAVGPTGKRSALETLPGGIGWE
jgi:endo-beta-N-acetylglucosaminidase D